MTSRSNGVGNLKKQGSHNGYWLLHQWNVTSLTQRREVSCNGGPISVRQVEQCVEEGVVFVMYRGHYRCLVINVRHADA